MPDQNDARQAPRIAHYFRDVDLSSNSCPRFIPELFSTNCWAEDWPARFLLRVAIRFHHIWATFGIRDGQETIHGAQPAVCFSNFSVADLIAVREGVEGVNKAVTQYAITFPTCSAERAGAEQVVQGGDLRAFLQKSNPVVAVTPEDVLRNEYRYVVCQLDMFNDQAMPSEWRWPYPRNYHRAIAKMEDNGCLGDKLPGFELTQKRWSGIGIVVATQADARRLQYDILSLIDQQILSESHFDHLLVCERLPTALEGLSEVGKQSAVQAAYFDFKSCMVVSDEAAVEALQDFSARISELELCTLKTVTRERGGCWVYFEDNTHPYVRALIKAGRVLVNKLGRYIGTLDELDRRRDLRERQEIVKVLCEQLQLKHGVACSYFSVLNSWRPDDLPNFCGRPWSGFYRITDEPDDEGDEENEGEIS